jgi:hypothetical protein
MKICFAGSEMVALLTLTLFDSNHRLANQKVTIFPVACVDFTMGCEVIFFPRLWAVIFFFRLLRHGIDSDLQIVVNQKCDSFR